MSERRVRVPAILAWTVAVATLVAALFSGLTFFYLPDSDAPMGNGQTITQDDGTHSITTERHVGESLEDWKERHNEAWDNR